MENEPISPAVVSLLNEQAEQGAKRKTRLDKGLEDTFPASDPVSVTHTATATGSAEPGNASPRGEALGLHPAGSAHPLGENALNTAESHRSSSPQVYEDELQAIRRDIESLRQRIGAFTSGTGRSARGEATAIRQRVQRAVNERSLALIGAVAAMSLAFAAMRRARIGRDYD